MLDLVKVIEVRSLLQVVVVVLWNYPFGRWKRMILGGNCSSSEESLLNCGWFTGT